MTIDPRSIHRAADFTPDRKQRLWLGRNWSSVDAADEPTVLWIMHNPSSADDRVDDPTVRRVMEFTDFWGFRAAVITNLIPFISSTPGEAQVWVDLGHAAECERYLRATVDLIANHGSILMVVAAWGAIARPDDVRRLEQALASYRLSPTLWTPVQTIHCLGKTQDGSPVHPLARGRNRPRLQAPIPYWKVTWA